MNYIGSKRKLADRIFSEINSRAKNGVFCDLFAGTGAVAEKFTDYDKLLVNDWETYSSLVLSQKFSFDKPDDLTEKLIFLNNCEPVQGFITDHYSPIGDRMYFTIDNAMKIDGIRIAIEENMGYKESHYFIALLLHAADSVANTASVYGAYLKSFKQTSKKFLNLIDRQKFSYKGEVFCSDANILINHIAGDILYLDPPYNTRHYGANYHILNTIIDWGDFIPQGITGLPPYLKSAYCSKTRIKNAFDDLLRDAQFSNIFISYNNEGILSPEDFKDICNQYGKLTTIVLDDTYQRFKADSKRKQSQTSTVEFLYWLEKC